MTPHIKAHREGFPWGLTLITQADEIELNTGITFSILKLQKGEQYTLNSAMESAILHLSGSLEVSIKGSHYSNTRNSLFDEAPFALHTPHDTEILFHAIDDVECAVMETPNEKTFPYVVYTPEKTGNEHRGEGLVDNASLRYVRTIFDNTNSHPNTELVLGEVVNFPGRWSSYPPHHHPQPEIYHYRFTDPRGYGHAELGEEVCKVKQYDTIKILDNLDHSQCSAPGYGMYYIWVIRHLVGNRYTIPEFTEEHRWTMEPTAEFWKGKSEAGIC